MTNFEKKYLKELSYEFKETTETEINNLNRKAWYDLNDLKEGVKPLFINHYWPVALNEIFPKEDYVCKSPRATDLEIYFKTRLFYAKELHDNNVLEPVVYYNSFHQIEDYAGFERKIKRAEGDDGTGAYEIIPNLIEFEDINKLNSPKLSYDKEKAYEEYLETKDMFDGILTTIRSPITFAAKISDEYSWYRGMENTYFDIYDNPEWMHDVLAKISNNFNERFDLLEQAGLWTCLDLSFPLGSAGLRYISGMKDFRDIKNNDYFNVESKTDDNWGFSCSEVFNCVSNDVHDEFTFQYDVKAMKRFKFCNVGCCEVLDKKIDLIKQFKNARKISVSEWCDYELAAASIKKDFVYSYRAAGVHFMGDKWDRKNAEKEIKGVLEASKKHNCNTEIVLNIGGTFNGNARKKAIEWSEMTNELINTYYL